jgi:hypothetical protein
MFEEKYLVYKLENSPFESFSQLPEQLTRARLDDLKQELKDFDTSIDKTIELDVQIEISSEKERSLLFLVKSKLERYLQDVNRLEGLGLNEEEKSLLSEIKAIILELSQDVDLYETLRDPSLTFANDGDVMQTITRKFPFVKDDVEILKSIRYLSSFGLIQTNDIFSEDKDCITSLRSFELAKNVVDLHKDWGEGFQLDYLDYLKDIYLDVSRSKGLIDLFKRAKLPLSPQLLNRILTWNSDKFVSDLLEANLLDEKSFKSNGMALKPLSADDKKLCLNSHVISGTKLREGFFDILLTKSLSGKRLLASRTPEEIQNVLKVFYLFFNNHVELTLQNVLYLLDSSVNLDLLTVLVREGVFNNAEFLNFGISVLENLDDELVGVIVAAQKKGKQFILANDIDFYKSLVQISKTSEDLLNRTLQLYRYRRWYPLVGSRRLNVCLKIIDLDLESTAHRLLGVRISLRDILTDGIKGFFVLLKRVRDKDLLDTLDELIKKKCIKSLSGKVIDLAILFKNLSVSDRTQAFSLYDNERFKDLETLQRLELAIEYTRNGISEEDLNVFIELNSLDNLTSVITNNMLETLRLFYSLTSEACGMGLAKFLNPFNSNKQVKIIKSLKKLKDFDSSEEVYSLQLARFVVDLPESKLDKVINLLNGGLFNIPIDLNQEDAGEPLIFDLNHIDHVLRVSELPDAQLIRFKLIGQEILNALGSHFRWLTNFRVSIQVFKMLDSLTLEERKIIYFRLGSLCDESLEILNFTDNVSLLILEQLHGLSVEEFAEFVMFFKKVTALTDLSIYDFQLDQLFIVFNAGYTDVFYNLYKVVGISPSSFYNLSLYKKIDSLSDDIQRNLFKLLGNVDINIEENVDFFIDVLKRSEGNFQNLCIALLKKRVWSSMYSELFMSNSRFKVIVEHLSDREFIFMKENLLLANYLTEYAPDVDNSNLDAIFDAYAKLLVVDSFQRSDVIKFLSLLNKDYLSTFSIDYIDEYKLISGELGLGKVWDIFLKDLDYSKLPLYVQGVIDTSEPFEILIILKEYKYYCENVAGLEISEKMKNTISSSVVDQKVVVDNSNFEVIGAFIERAFQLVSYYNGHFELLSDYKFGAAYFFSKLIPGINFSEDPLKVFISNLEINLDLSNITVEKISFLLKVDEIRAGAGLTKTVSDRLSKIPSLDTLAASDSLDLNHLPNWFNPFNLEALRLFYGEKIGFSKATEQIYNLFQRFMDVNLVTYQNIEKYIDFSTKFKKVKFDLIDNSNGEVIYRLLGNFLLNQVANFLVEKLGPDEKNLSMVEDALKSQGVQFEELIKNLNKNGFHFELKQSSLSKAARSLKKGKVSYLFSSGWAKLKSRFGSKPEKLDEISVERRLIGWRSPEGVSVEALVQDNRENAKLLYLNPENVRFGMEMGSGALFNPQDRLKSYSDVFFFASLAFSSSHGEITELAFDRGKVVSQLLSTKGKDAFVFVNFRGQLSILDKRDLMLHDIYEALGLPIRGENRRLRVAQNLRDYTLFIRLIKQSRASMLASMMFVTNGEYEISSNVQEKSRRILLQYEDGNIAILDSTDDMSTNDAIQLALASGKLKYAVYMDTGNFDTAFYYESEDHSHQLGHNANDYKSSNILVLSSRVKPMSRLEVQEPQVVGRFKWGAEKPRDGAEFTRYSGDLSDVLTSIVVHHSAMPKDSGPLEIQKQVMQNGYDDIGYHFIIGSDGTIYEGRAIDVMGAHAGQSTEANREARAARESGLSVDETRKLVEEAQRKDPDYGSIGVVLTGDLTNSEPTKPQQSALKELLAYLKVRYKVKTEKIIGHIGVQAHIIESQGLTSTGDSETGDSDVHKVCPGEHGLNMLSRILDVLPADDLNLD